MSFNNSPEIIPFDKKRILKRFLLFDQDNPIKPTRFLKTDLAGWCVLEKVDDSTMSLEEEKRIKNDARLYIQILEGSFFMVMGFIIGSWMKIGIEHNEIILMSLMFACVFIVFIIKSFISFLADSKLRMIEAKRSPFIKIATTGKELFCVNTQWQIVFDGDKMSLTRPITSKEIESITIEQGNFNGDSDRLIEDLLKWVQPLSNLPVEIYPSQRSRYSQLAINQVILKKELIH